MKHFLLIFLLLLVPVLGVLAIHPLSWPLSLLNVLVCACLTELLLFVQRMNKHPRTILKSILVAFYFLFLFLLMFEVILYDFTGKGFNNEVYFHIELESLRIALNEYPFQLIGFVMLIGVYAFLINKLLNKAISHRKTFQLLTLLVLVIAVMNSSMARFTVGFYTYIHQEKVVIDQSIMDRYNAVGVLTRDQMVTRLQTQAKAANPPKNLILLYLESFNSGLLDLAEYPALTPHLNHLTENHHQLPHLSSSFVTIEGIISSQCGTMLPMTAGNNTFLNSGQLMSNMPCLGDVLKKAGYTQYYLGGAAMEFAGKGKFLEEHGYDHIWGSEYWYANGFKKPEGVWGLSDSQLFDNAINTITEAAKNPPFNVTLLTLGTHLPGYTYEGCEPYTNSTEPFINAIHCTDQLVGQFVDELQQKQLLNDTVLMIVADHGVFPTPKMKELFGDMVQDRRLVAITNYPIGESDALMSTYDLAPTLLDMLGINHNAVFLFGRSYFDPMKSVQNYVTRYLDWQGELMVSNDPGPCHDQALSWPLNACHKQQLLSLTSQILGQYSIPKESEYLSCQLDVRLAKEPIDDGKHKVSLMLNDANHFDHFFDEGYLLNSKNISQGLFAFELGEDLSIEGHHFFRANQTAGDKFQALINQSETEILVLQVVESVAETSISASLYTNQQKRPLKNGLGHKLDSIPLCF